MTPLIDRIAARKATAEENGSTIPFYVIFMFTMLVVLIIAVDMSSAMLIHEARNNDLAQAKHIVESDAYALDIKNNDQPGEKVASLIVDTLRKSGYKGEITVYFYECSKSDLPANRRASRRVFAWAAKTSEDYHLFFGENYGIRPITIQAALAGTIMPYSGGTTWRPDASYDPSNRDNQSYHAAYNGIYVSPDDTSSLKFTRIDAGYDSDRWPTIMQDALQTRFDEIAAEKTSRQEESG